jgi:hypothetical protein
MSCYLSLAHLVSQVVTLDIGDNNRMVLPSDSQLEALGRSDLVAQIKRYGGRQDVARRLGMDSDTSRELVVNGMYFPRDPGPRAQNRSCFQSTLISSSTPWSSSE